MSLVVCVTSLVLLLAVGPMDAARVVKTLESPRTTGWGHWGQGENCPEGMFAQVQA